MDRNILEHIGFLLDACASRANQSLVPVLKEHGLTPGSYYVLLVVSGDNGLSQKQLAENLYLNVNTVTRLIDDLEQKRYAKRQENPDNRKEKFLEITALGQLRVEAALKTVSSLRDIAYNALNKQEQKELHRLLLKLYQAGDPG